MKSRPCRCYREEFIDFRSFENENDAKISAMQERKSLNCISVSIEHHVGPYLIPHFVVAIERQKSYEQPVPIHWSQDYSLGRKDDGRGCKKRLRKPDPTKHFELESDELEILTEKLQMSRMRHRNGWKDLYKPTRARYWRPANNNWKRHRAARYR